jgi:hypothetical protein
MASGHTRGRVVVVNDGDAPPRYRRRHEPSTRRAQGLSRVTAWTHAHRFALPVQRTGGAPRRTNRSLDLEAADRWPPIPSRASWLPSLRMAIFPAFWRSTCGKPSAPAVADYKTVVRGLQMRGWVNGSAREGGGGEQTIREQHVASAASAHVSRRRCRP